MRLTLPRQLAAMRWWLGLAFACVAALTAVAVVEVLGQRSETAFRKYGEEFALGNTSIASQTLRHDASLARLRHDTAAFANQHHLSLFVFDSHGRALTAPVSDGVKWTSIPNRGKALAADMANKRYVEGAKDGSAFLLAFHLGRSQDARLLVSYSLRPELTDQLGIVHGEFFTAGLVAFGVGAALGLLIATLTARRLARIARAARSIGAGDFDVAVEARFPDEVGSLAGSIELMRSQLQELFRALEIDRNRLERLVERLNEGVVLVDPALNVEFANGRAKDLLGVEDHLSTARLADMGIRRFALDLFESGLPGRLRITDGDQTLLVSGVPPTTAGENAIIVVLDESEHARNEKAQREFATNAAHELRTPLASIVTAVEMLRTGAKDDPEARDDFLDVIAREAGRLTRLTRALLVLARAEARLETPRIGTVEVAPLLEEVAASLTPRDGVDVSVDCPPSLAIAGDADLLEQAVSSVAANALQHTASGSVTMRGRSENGTVVIEVADTGTGIAPDMRNRIFDRFYSARNSGSGFGLGLSIAREAVTALGGEIALDPDAPVGTTIRISLTRAEDEA